MNSFIFRRISLMQFGVITVSFALVLAGVFLIISNEAVGQESGNSTLNIERLFPGEFDNTRYSLTLEDPEGISEFFINTAGGDFVFGGEPKNGTPPCPSSVRSGTVTLFPSDFPLSGYVIDCENEDVQNSVEVSMPPLPDTDDGIITGYKFYDVDGEGGPREDGEPGIGNWLIALVGADGTAIYETYENGYYTFAALGEGTYAVCETAYGNWTQTYPTEGTPGAIPCGEEEWYAPWGWEVEIDQNGDIVDGPESFDFGNATELGTVRVVKFNDLNGDGIRDIEPGMENIPICLQSYGLASGFDNLDEFFFGTEDFNECQGTNWEGVAEWSGLPAGSYGVWEEEVPEGWMSTNQTSWELELVSGQTQEFFFGNRKPWLVVYKYDSDEWELLPDWEICLYKTLNEPYFDEESETWVVGELAEVECRETINDFNEEDEENGEGQGQFHGAAVFSGENLEPGQWYVVDEEERDEWRLDGWDYEGFEEVEVLNEELGQVLIRLNEDFLDNSNDASLYLYNQGITGDIVALKYLDENRGLAVRGWEICLREFDEESGTPGPVIGECQETDANGMAQWQNLLPGTYILDEEEREDWGWRHQGFSIGNFENADWEDFDSEAGQAMVLLGENGYAEIHFLNWVNDNWRPQSSFEDTMEYEVIETEIVSLELRGISVDVPARPAIIIGDEEPREDMGSSGIRDAVLTVRQLAGSETIENYPSSSFFDVFTELRCPEPEAIPIEIVPLSLTSVDPITVSWNYNWTPSGLGIYCFEVRATDNAGNPEETGYAGPVAYVPVAQVSEQITEDVSTVSFTAVWTTNEPATSRVIYDTVSHPELGEAPNYGYALSTDEQDTDPKVISHSVAVSGLTSGTTYFYRTVSKASPESVGGEQQITTSGSSSSNSPSSGGGGYAFSHYQGTTINGTVIATPDNGGETTLSIEGGNKIKLAIPPDTVSENTTFTITPAIPGTFDEPDPTKGLIKVGNNVYEISAFDGDGPVTSFSRNLTITISYSDDDIVGLDETAFEIYWWDDAAGQWVVLDSRIDENRNEVTVSVNHLTIFALAGETTIPASGEVAGETVGEAAGESAGEVAEEVIIEEAVEEAEAEAVEELTEVEEVTPAENIEEITVEEITVEEVVEQTAVEAGEEPEEPIAQKTGFLASIGTIFVEVAESFYGAFQEVSSWFNSLLR